MPERKNDFEINKNIKDLEYKKLLNEYNAWLIALISIGLGILGFVHNATNNLILAFLSSIATILAINIKREEKSNELKNKIIEIKNLKGESSIRQ